MLNIIFWLTFGFLTGWIGAILTNGIVSRTAPIVLAGIGGGIIGGASTQLLTTDSLLATQNPASLFGAVFSAILLVAIVTVAHQESTSR